MTHSNVVLAAAQSSQYIAAASGPEAITPIDITPVVPARLSSGIIPTAALNAPLEVRIPRYEDTEDEDRIFLTLNGSPVNGLDGTPVDPAGDTVIYIAVADLAALADGTHAITFTQGSGFGDEYGGNTLDIIIDKTPPGGDLLPPIRFKTGYVENGITLQQLLNDPDTPNVLRGNIATYKDQQAGDLMYGHLQTMPGGAIVNLPTAVRVEVPDEAHIMDFDLATLITAGATGTVDFWYTVEDTAGNKKDSPRSSLRMLIVGGPEELTAPRVPLFSDDDIVNEADARTPITVEVPQYKNAKVGDIITVDLGSVRVALPALTAADLPADPANPDPALTLRAVQIPYVLLGVGRSDEGDATSPVFSLPCFYEVGRENIFTVESPRLTVDFDLTIPGGPDPDPETPVNENLGKPVITHAGDPTDENHIPIGYTPPVIATIPHLSVEPIPSEVFEDGDVVRLFLYEADGTTERQVGDEVPATPGVDVVITIPEATVADDEPFIVPGHWQYFYKVGRPIATGFTNQALSPSQEVVVDDATEQPGGPDPLPELTFRNAELKSGFQALGYARSQVQRKDSNGDESDGVVVRIYQYLNMTEGDTIAIDWRGNDALRGTGADIPEATFAASYTVKAADLNPKDDRLDDDPSRPPTQQPRVYVDIIVPYAEILKVKSSKGIQAYGSAWVSWTVKALSGASNSSGTDRTKTKPLVIDARQPV